MGHPLYTYTYICDQVCITYICDQWWASRKLAVKVEYSAFFFFFFFGFLNRETRDLHVGLHGSQRLPAQRLLPPDRRTVETTLGHTVSQLPRLYGFLFIISQINCIGNTNGNILQYAKRSDFIIERRFVQANKL